MTWVRRRRGMVELTLTRDEAHVVRALTSQVATLLAPDGDRSEAGDSIEALVDLAAEAVPAPDDPALKRLLPDAYGDDDAAAGEFRRLMDGELRRNKVAALETVSDAVAAPLADPGGEDCVFTLGPDDTETWLQALNDVRLVLGTRLDVTEEMSELIESLGPDDPRLPLLLAYDWLGGLQEALLQALDG